MTSQAPTKYALGSVLNHVLLHQTVIGIESKRQLDMAGVYPDVVVGCIGGGSNFAGFTYPFLADKLAGKAPDLRVVAIEPAAAPSLTRGVYAYDFGDTSMMTPLTKMFTLGHGFMPAPIHAGGLRYHGMASSICEIYRHKLIEARAVQQIATFEAGVLFARAEGIVPAPEAAHAVRGAIDEAIRCREQGKAETIAFNLCGHGHFDMASYERYFSGKLDDYELPQAEIDRAVAATTRRSRSSASRSRRAVARATSRGCSTIWRATRPRRGSSRSGSASGSSPTTRRPDSWSAWPTSSSGPAATSRRSRRPSSAAPSSGPRRSAEASLGRRSSSWRAHCERRGRRCRTPAPCAPPSGTWGCPSTPATPRPATATAERSGSTPRRSSTG